MNVIVNLSTPLIDGTEVVFKAPCDAHAVTGLMVHYPNYGSIESQEFLFADAHANDVGDIADLFAKDAVVKVILDLDTHKAFVQNGDTNAYLEARFNALSTTVFVRGNSWDEASMNSNEINKAVSEGKNVIFVDRYHQWYHPLAIGVGRSTFYRCQAGLPHLISMETVFIDEDGKISRGNRSLGIVDDSPYLETGTTWSSRNIVDKLCPSFEKTGTLVQCEPVMGSQLDIASTGSKAQFSVCGKNLYDSDKYPLTNGYYINKGSGAEAGGGVHADYCATRDFIPVMHLRGMTITLNHIPGGSAPGMAFYDSDKVRTDPLLNGKGDNQKVPDDAVYMKFSTYINNKDEVQIEIGSTSTAYEKYTGRSIESEGPAGLLSVQGINNVFAYNNNDEAVDITVTGKADPVAIIDKLTNAIISLGGNV